jgi:hypothetical protein
VSYILDRKYGGIDLPESQRVRPKSFRINDLADNLREEKGKKQGRKKVETG